jgi:hypothetical protein
VALQPARTVEDEYLNSRRYFRKISLPYGLVLFLNLFSLAAFLAVIGIGLGFHSWPVTLVGVLLSTMFVTNCAIIVKTGRRRWDSLRKRESG